SSRTALLNSIDNRNVRELMALYLKNGNLTANDVVETEKQLANTARVKPTSIKNPRETAAISESLLWNIATNHAYQGVINFVTTISAPLRQNNLSIGTVFFPNGNRTELCRYESIFNQWDRFPHYIFLV
ncbi:MAG: hypothetical protein ACK556_24535, partial [Pseudanabaena sp.]